MQFHCSPLEGNRICATRQTSVCHTTIQLTTEELLPSSCTPPGATKNCRLHQYLSRLMHNTWLDRQRTWDVMQRQSVQHQQSQEFVAKLTISNMDVVAKNHKKTFKMWIQSNAHMFNLATLKVRCIKSVQFQGRHKFRLYKERYIVVSSPSVPERWCWITAIKCYDRNRCCYSHLGLLDVKKTPKTLLPINPE